MLIPSAMFANAASNEGGLLHVQGGGWEWFNLQRLPGTVHGAVAAIVELEPGHTPTPVEASVTGPDDRTQVFGAQVIEDPSEDQAGGRLALVVPMAFVARTTGTYVVTVADAAGPLTSLELDVRLVAPPSLPSA